MPSDIIDSLGQPLIGSDHDSIGVKRAGKLTDPVPFGEPGAHP
jgi:hypothetical protein